MQVPLIDKSTYLRGLLILARKDKRISEEDKKFIILAAEFLGFSSDFYRKALDTFLINKYINNDPVEFRNTILAHHFISDAITLACINDGISHDEKQWLMETAKINFVDAEWFDNEFNKCRELISTYDYSNLALYSVA
jgi:hypothetical protein